jgi:hypothetical protein
MDVLFISGVQRGNGMPLHIDVIQSNRWRIIASGDIEEGTTGHVVNAHDHVRTIFPNVPKSRFCVGLRYRRWQFRRNVVPPPCKSLLDNRGCITKRYGSFCNLLRE